MQPAEPLQPTTANPNPIRVAVAFAAFPARDLAPYKYFVLLLNHLQLSCEFELVDLPEDDPFVRMLMGAVIADADIARDGLSAFGERVRDVIKQAIEHHDLAVEQPDQIVVVSGVTTTDYHYLLRRGSTTLLALGQWEQFMAPPSLAEFLQLLLLRAPYSALEGHVGTRFIGATAAASSTSRRILKIPATWLSQALACVRNVRRH